MFHDLSIANHFRSIKVLKTISGGGGGGKWHRTLAISEMS